MISLVRVGTMMLGELDFLGTYLRPMRVLDSSAWYQIVAATWFLVVFIVLMPILLMNLLVSEALWIPCFIKNSVLGSVLLWQQPPNRVCRTTVASVSMQWNLVMVTTSWYER